VNPGTSGFDWLGLRYRFIQAYQLISSTQKLTIHSMQKTEKTFIETQFPVSLISKESYKERKAVAGQTLTKLGKWWGRKPLILIRASILGMLIPASSNPKKDRDIFLKILTMDAEGLWQRRSTSISAKTIEEWLPEHQAKLFFEINGRSGVRWTKGLDQATKDEVTRSYFDHLSYDEKLEYCDRPEQIEGPSETAWQEINAHLGTTANNIHQLIDQLGKKRFGHTPRVGDAFCGGGSIPFEAARIGCDVYGSDLNPVAALLTWASINLIGGGKDVQEKVQAAQQAAFAAADEQITEWGIEHNAQGWRADAYLYCVEAVCPATDYLLPLAPSWVIAEKNNICAVLKPDHANKRYDIEVVVNADKETFAKAQLGTVQNGRMVCPETGESFSIPEIRGDKKINGETIYGLRLWENEDLVPRTDDTFQERLYCVRWVETYTDNNAKGELVEKTRRHYCSVTQEDLQRELQVIELLKKRFSDWQVKGYIPSRKIERGGDKTEEPIRTRGWSYWHHLFNPRQLLLNGLFISSMQGFDENSQKFLHLLLGRFVNNNARLSRWKPSQSGGIGGVIDVFSNQALNTFYNYSTRGFYLYGSLDINLEKLKKISGVVELKDARNINIINDIWVTDPPYADAVNYHEISEFFCVWYGDIFKKATYNWYIDTKKSLAVKGSGNSFKHSMVDIYKNLTIHMPNNGLQMVQFTHQDPAVWADLGMILWAAGLQVSAAWTIATETESSLKKGNYVQGTVLLVLRKRLSDTEVFPDELPSLIEDEVRAQLDEMLALDDKELPNFSDTDYQLAAYAAALRVMTQYSSIEGINIENELYREKYPQGHKQKNQKSAFEELIDQAVEIACNHLIPIGFDEFQWKGLAASERLYLKGLELEKHGELRAGAYQELAKGFGVREYAFMFAKTKANEVRFKTGTEFKRSNLGGDNFAGSLMRHVLFALHETVTKENAREGVNYLKTEVTDFWGNRKKIMEILHYLNRLAHIDHMPHWEVDAEAAQTLAGAIENFNA
jgi:putative DNA methylase